jgi:hypothetical protein
MVYTYIEAHAHIPFGNPFFTSPPFFFPLYLPALIYPFFTDLEIPSLCCGGNSRPLLSPVGSKLNPPHPPTSPFPLNGLPYSSACPPKMTLRYRLCIVRYSYPSLCLSPFLLPFLYYPSFSYPILYYPFTIIPTVLF